MTRLYIGLDVHSKQTTFAIQSEDGKMVGEGAVPTTPQGFQKLRDQFELPVGTIAGLETGTVAFYDGAAPLGTATVTTLNGVTTASLTTSAPEAGPHRIRAVYQGDTNFKLSSTVDAQITTVARRTSRNALREVRSGRGKFRPLSMALY